MRRPPRPTNAYAKVSPRLIGTRPSSSPPKSLQNTAKRARCRARRALAYVPRLTKTYRACLSELRIVPGSAQARAIARVVVNISAAPELPLQGDFAGPLPARQTAVYEEHEARSLLSAYAHRVPRRRLWVWYCLRDIQHVHLFRTLIFAQVCEP